MSRPRPAGPATPTPSRRARANPDSIANHGIDDVTSHYAKIIDSLPARPILDRPLLRRHDRREAARHGLRRGRHRHRRRADQGRAAAAAVLAARHPAGVQEPGQQAQGRLADRQGVPLQLRQRPVARRSPTTCYERWAIPAPGKPLFEAAAANFSLHSPDKVNTAQRGPRAAAAHHGRQDHTVPEAITKSTLKQYRHSVAVTDLEEFPTAVTP